MRTRMKRDLARLANEAASTSRRVASAPILEASSSFLTVCEWLKWNDPNGEHEPEDHTPDSAWEALEGMVNDE